MRFQSVLIILLCLSISFLTGQPLDPSPCCVDYCYTEDQVRPQNTRMNTKTAYQLVKEENNITVPTGCTPVKFWMLSRHGTRLPTPSHIPKLEKLTKYQIEILANYAAGNQPAVGALCAGDLNLLENWRWNPNITDEMGDFLTEQGWKDLKGIAEYYKSQFPSLFGEYSPEKYFFRHTDTERTDESFKAFISGLFEKRIPDPVVPSKDTLLRPYDNCDAWKDQKKALDDSSSEVSKWKDSKIYQKFIQDVSTKAGYPSSLKEKDIEYMFEMCAFEIAWDIGSDSAWCSLFTLEQIKLLEYAKDLSEYYESGPAGDINSHLSCELIQDMIGKLRSPEGPRVTAYFGHSTTFQLLITSLGFPIQKTPLRADNYEELLDRPWRTSKNSPFATNLAVVRYDCGDGRQKLQFLVNQQPIQLEFCSPDGLCDLETVLSKYSTIASADCSRYFCPSAEEKEYKVTLYVNH